MTFDRSAPPAGFVIGDAWGHGTTHASQAALPAPALEILRRIRSGSVERELERRLPNEEIGWLRNAGLTALRVPKEYGGHGIGLADFFDFLIKLSEADSNLTQALRAHFGYVEHILTSSPERRDVWLPRLAGGAIVGAAWSETGDARQERFSTRLTREAGGWRLNGAKFYTTGSLFADWIHVGASGAQGEPVAVTIDRHAPGVEVVDDWDGMGQRLTASGTSRFTDTPVDPAEIVSEAAPFSYSEAYYQLVHLATLAGIGRAAATDAAAAVAARKRSYSHAPAARPADDPQVLQVIGRLRAHAYSAGAIVAQAARALERAANADSGATGNAVALTIEAELEIWQAQTVVSQLILDATAEVFDALGASATLRSAGLDRYWRNARTITSHNPRVYKDRIVGNFAVNGALPPGQWRIGEA
ncbi:alkylation response protein AidB-like acyl-CoA dehydrogenase [Paraburkholderia sp. GAS333]|uniref:acyl-CoA dehydrogenase family protein n=1 Tax=Paraburkholderia sp. GAS333 TaxID=3156279 RepID=UPI003D1ECF2C